MNDTPWKINGWNLQPSPVNRKENDLNQTSMIMFHVNLQGCIPLMVLMVAVTVMVMMIYNDEQEEREG